MSFFSAINNHQILTCGDRMQRFVDSIRKSVNDKNWFAAIFMALAMPDVCGSLETPGTGNVGERYRRWFNIYLKDKYDIETDWELRLLCAPETARRMMEDARFAEHIEHQKKSVRERALRFTADDCYKFRCACLHTGMARRERGAINMTPPLASSGVVHMCIVNGDLQLQIDIFCEDVCKAVELWAENNKNDTDIQQRISDLIEVKPLQSNGVNLFGPY